MFFEIYRRLVQRLSIIKLHKKWTKIALYRFINTGFARLYSAHFDCTHSGYNLIQAFIFKDL
jgi:hypothetical protein